MKAFKTKANQASKTTSDLGQECLETRANVCLPWSQNEAGLVSALS